MKKFLLNTQRTQKFLKSLSKIYVIVRWEGFEVKELYFLLWSHPDRDHSLGLNDIITYFFTKREGDFDFFVNNYSFSPITLHRFLLKAMP